jgi:hypothetical protein
MSDAAAERDREARASADEAVAAAREEGPGHGRGVKGVNSVVKEKEGGKGE